MVWAQVLRSFAKLMLKGEDRELGGRAQEEGGVEARPRKSRVGKDEGVLRG